MGAVIVPPFNLILAYGVREVVSDYAEYFGHWW